MSVCAACGREFSCGMADKTGGEPCWCASVPPLQSLRPGEACLCPQCLAQRLAAEKATIEKPALPAC